MNERGDSAKLPHLTSAQLDQIASVLGPDVIVPYVPPARPFTLGDRATWGIHRDYQSQQPHTSEAHMSSAVEALSRRLAAALGAPVVASVSTVWPDLERADESSVDKEQYSDAIVICGDVLQRVADPTALLQAVRDLLTHAALVIVSVPLRPLTLAADDLGPPSKPEHAREWTLPELIVGLDAYGIEPLFGGTLAVTASDGRESPIGVVVASCRTPTAGHVP